MIRNLTLTQAQIVGFLAKHSPNLVTLSQLVEEIYPNPDTEPEYAGDAIKVQIYKIRQKWQNEKWRIGSILGPGGGYFIEGGDEGSGERLARPKAFYGHQKPTLAELGPTPLEKYINLKNSEPLMEVDD